MQDTELEYVGDTKYKIQLLPLTAHSLVIETWQMGGFAYTSMGNKLINELSLWKSWEICKIYWLNSTGYKINYGISWTDTKCYEKLLPCAGEQKSFVEERSESEPER